MEQEKQVIEGEIIELDNKSFRDVTLRRCSLVFSGGRPPFINNVDFDGCSFRLEGAALNTAEFIGGIARGGGESLSLGLSFIGLDPVMIEELAKKAVNGEKRSGE